MSELRRLRDLDGELGAAFRSAEIDAPRPGAKAALLSALGTGLGAAGAAKVAAAATTAKTAGVAGASVAPSAAGAGVAAGAGATAKASIALVATKWIIASAVIVGGTAATTYAVKSTAPATQSAATTAIATATAPPPRSPPVAAKAAPIEGATPPDPSNAGDDAVPAAALPRAPGPSKAAPMTTTPAPIANAAAPADSPHAPVANATAPLGTDTGARSDTAPASPAPPPRAASTVSDEIAALDRARRELASGRAAEAVATLERYRTRFPAGVMEEEARVLEIEALARAGRGARARELGAAFLATRPASPLAPRVRRIVDGP